MQLYLDTARYGLPTPRVRKAGEDLLRFFCDEGYSSMFSVLLEEGFSAWPERYQREYPGLADWEGVGELKSAVRSLVRASERAPVYFSSRSAQLMRLGVRMLLTHSERPLTTDLLWPGYRRILEDEAKRKDRRFVSLPLRSFVFDEGAAREDVLRRILSVYRDSGCDGLFFPAVTHDGVRLPLFEVARELRETNKPRFVLADGAQEVGHVRADASQYDFYIFGVHKWLRGLYPMGVGIAAHEDARVLVRHVIDSTLRIASVENPLLVFTSELEGEDAEAFSETVDVSPLFSSRAALRDAREASEGEGFARITARARELRESVTGSEWQVVPLHPTLQAGVVLLRSTNRGETPPSALRRELQERGVVLSAYEDGVARAAVALLGDEELFSLREAFRG